MHAFKTLNFVFTLIYLLVHIFLNPAMAPKALAILLLFSFPQSLSHDIKLLRYSNSVTLSSYLFPTFNFSSVVSLPNTSVLVLLMFILSPAASPAAFEVLMFARNICRRCSIRSMSSANLRLFSWYPCMKMPMPLSRSPSITLSRYVMKAVGDNGSPCRVPIDNVNHSSMSCPT